MGWRKVELESDCKLVVDKINAKEEVASIATIQLDIWRLMKEFYKCCCSFTRRSNNYVSHYLAKFAITLIDVAEWKLSFPAWLLELVQADVQEQLLWFGTWSCLMQCYRLEKKKKKIKWNFTFTFLIFKRYRGNEDKRF